MSGSFLFGTPRRLRRAASLTLVFGAVLLTGAATGAWGSADPKTMGAAAGSAGAQRRDAAAPRGTALLRGGNISPDLVQELISSSGDRWAAYYTPQEYAGLQQSLDGEYVGVGLWVRRAADGAIKVVQVQPGTPAADAGVAVGDRLRSIDGKSVDGSAVTEVTSRLRGGPDDTAGTPVTLELQRDGERWRVTMRRAVLSSEDVLVEHLRGKVTEITISAFNRGVGEQVQKAVRRPEVASDARRGGGVVLDLRGNSGGLVVEAADVASAFLDGGLIATYDVHGEERALFADPGGNATVPLVILVDGGTMSAAEMLAGALQDLGRAVVVGSKTFGKGSVQQPSTLPDGSVVESTVGHYRTPSGRSLDGSGVKPDLTVDPGTSPEAAERQASTVLGGLGPRT